MRFLYKWLGATLAGGFAPRCLEMVRISSLVSISEGTQQEKKRPLGKRGFARAPTGMIVYHAAGDTPISPKKLSVQFLSDVLAAGIASYLLSLSIATYWKRVGLAVLLGAFGLFAISSIYWNWYGFSNAFFLAQGLDMIVGWSLAGAVITKLIPPARL